ncbi:hypothetical protein GNI_133080 [Gregarina niphandrodes]|uniref:Uncharacterized protein n=1 Tax=Gregarina niphandrodes TaxID=110365 RepID=A0A023B1F8_GRENI|nr:hypothetical protein GNI_133080 [Gregarina niphandrodes]EZG46740.1 hypothetical protein GNI_133080 [Gregarina niphandrodes]|eukprot:XP_011132249.1 hypothetical protein GNI_133080 [Gregarina niphandrodes]
MNAQPEPPEPEPREPEPHVDEGVDISAANYEELIDGGNMAPEDDEVYNPLEGLTKSQKALQLMLNPEHKENNKSLWTQLFIPSLTNINDIDFLKAELGDDPRNPDAPYLEWYNQLLFQQRAYLQTAFEEPTALPVLSKRVANYLRINKATKLTWRQQWIDEYTKYLEHVKKAESGNAERAKQEALEKRKRKLELMRQHEATDAPYDEPDEYMASDESPKQGCHHRVNSEDTYAEGNTRADTRTSAGVQGVDPRPNFSREHQNPSPTEEPGRPNSGCNGEQGVNVDEVPDLEELRRAALLKRQERLKTKRHLAP